MLNNLQMSNRITDAQGLHVSPPFGKHVLGEDAFTVLSLFDGMSCGQLALKRAGIKVKQYFASEIKQHAIKVTQHNFPNTIQLGSVVDVKASDLPKIDILIGGSPCQDFSLANKERKGLEGVKSGLFFEYLRLLKECKPKYYLLENVAMTDKDMELISQYLGTYPVNINSELVSAQMRNRFYWTNIGPEEFDLFGFRYCKIPQPKNRKIKLQDILENGYTEMQKSRCILESESRPLKQQHKMAHRFFNSGFTTLITKDKETFLRVKEATKIGFVDIGNNEAVDLSYPTSETRRGRLMKDKSNCLLRNNQYFVFQDGDLRYFTQTELERLQTVPEGYTSILKRNDAACLLGDGWTVDVIAHIFSFIKKEVSIVDDARCIFA
jgi:DNA-cytosine methyltransferase